MQLGSPPALLASVSNGNSLSWRDSSWWDAAAQMSVARRGLSAAVLSTTLGSPPVLLASVGSTSTAPDELDELAKIVELVLELCTRIVATFGPIVAVLKLAKDMVEWIKWFVAQWS